jgi:hypothetical protein
MANRSEALWNEVARLINKEFFEYGQPVTGTLLAQLIIAINEMLTEDNGSD